MGIKLRCPNGHKLNVKSFLAGRRGICPECGAKFEIPAAPEHDDGDGGGSHIDLVPAPAPTPVPQPQMLPAPAPVIPQPASMVRQQAAYGAGVQPLPPPSMLPAPAFAAAMPLDPLLEMPQANWYVRPPSGGQYGPAQGEMVRRWIGEGRLTAESWVWREGWADWQPAAQALAMHFAPATAAAPAPLAFGAPAFGAPAAAAPVNGFGAMNEPAPLARAHGARRHGNKKTLMIVTVVLAVLTVLAAVFAAIYIFNLLLDQ